ncbi:hypothetical protein WJX72_006665 [[Myrmecia] bisecta]|uniref:Defective in cullin neddylation protein n=1 Tax=[Myrmecia] bisecta TaxID=41462 RepID=A0AAW1PX13_9CHLO
MVEPFVWQGFYQGYQRYAELISQPPGAQQHNVREGLAQLHCQLQASIAGEPACAVLRAHEFRSQLQDLDRSSFTSLYRFVFFVCRDPGRRNLQVSRAIEAWTILLVGRFRLLEQWCAFVTQHQTQIITEDVWRQVLDFSRSVPEDLGTYDPESAWPVLLDEFVDSVKRNRSSCFGSKRRCIDMDTVSHQLSELTTVEGLVASPPAKRLRIMRSYSVPQPG